MENKKNLVMIVGEYYPSPSPTGKCAEQYINLLGHTFSVDVICIADETDTPFTFKDKRVFPVTTKYYSMQKKLKKRKSQICWNLSKIPTHVLDRFRSPNNLHWYVKAAYRKLEMINAEKTIDVVFSVGAPTSSHCAARLFKQAHLDIRWVTYTVDSYSAQNGNKKRYRDFEKRLLEKADYNLLSEEIHQNCQFLWGDKPERFGTLPYLMPERQNPFDEMIFDPKKINFVYAGSFYKQLRDPTFMLKVFCNISSDCILHLFCPENCDSYIKDAIKTSDGQIIKHKSVAVEDIAKVYASADVLINLGNSVPEFKPSKIYEYIASGKPIVDIYYDRCKETLLHKYPYAVQIRNDNDIVEAADVIHDFGVKNRGKICSEEEIACLYCENAQQNIREKLVNALDWEY